MVALNLGDGAGPAGELVHEDRNTTAGHYLTLPQI